MGACRSLLTAAILNLAINARNAMPNGGRKRLIALQTREGDGETQAPVTGHYHPIIADAAEIPQKAAGFAALQPQRPRP
jgi:hypothetical protein